MAGIDAYWQTHAAEKVVAQRAIDKGIDGEVGGARLLRSARIVTGFGLAESYRESLFTKISSRLVQLAEAPFAAGDEALAVELVALADAARLLSA